jgi:Uma2 family endonuclease
MEVLSPSTRSKDQVLKLNKYMNAGCKEIWIVDPDNERVTVYYFEGENWPYIYNFDDKVPVGISEGKCEVDFAKVKEKVSWIPE